MDYQFFFALRFRWFFDETGWYYVMLVTADLDNEIDIKTGENIWKEMPFQLCLSPAVISYLFLQNAKLLEGCACVHKGIKCVREKVEGR